ncbi:MAG: hypothetical protein ACM3L6_05615 [Deltaproteobacteria bacterium]
MQTRLCAWGGIVFLGLAYFMGGLEDAGWAFFGRLLYAGGYVLTGCGTYMYSRGKGYRAAVGLLGLLGPAGLAVVYVLRDRSGLVLKQRARERRN